MEIIPNLRDEQGLVVGVNYIRSEDGLIDWRKMVSPEFLVPNKKAFEKNLKPIPETIEGLADNELLILLGGIKKLARLRGFTKVEYALSVPTPDYVASVCRIEWTPNFETGGATVVSSGIADAHCNNTDGFGKMYLAAIAENRSFVRCVRNFLGINIVGQDEIGPKGIEEIFITPAQSSPATVLAKLMAEKSVSFVELKAKLIAEEVDGASEFNTIADIPIIKIFELLDRLKKKKP